jgi:hypothetical protein
MEHEYGSYDDTLSKLLPDGDPETHASDSRRCTGDAEGSACNDQHGHWHPSEDTRGGVSAHATASSDCIYAWPPTKRLVQCSVCCACVSAILLLAFLVFIPLILQDIVDECNVDVVSVVLRYPGNTTFSTETTVKMSSTPMPVSMQFTDLHIACDLVGGDEFIKLQKSNRVKVTEAARTLRTAALVENSNALSDMMYYVLNNASYSWQLTGSADVTAIVAANVNIDKTVSMKGYNGFPYPPAVLNFTVTEGTPTVLYSSARCSLHTDANTAFLFGQDMYFNAVYDGYSVGSGIIPNASFYTGTFDFFVVFASYYNTDEERMSLMKLMTNYIQGVDTTVMLNRFYLGDQINWLTAPLDSVVMEAVIPGVASKMVEQFDLYITLPNPLHIDLTLDGFNPTDINMTIVKVVGDVLYKNVVVGVVHDVGISYLLPPLTVTTSPLLKAEIVPTEMELVTELAVAGYGLVDIHVMLTAYLESFEINITYTQYNVSAYIHEGL